MVSNPGVSTLYEFLKTIRDRSPASFSDVCDSKNSGYGMVSRYIKFCVEHSLIQVIENRRARGRYPSKLYGLTEHGFDFLDIFRGLEKIG